MAAAGSTGKLQLRYKPLQMGYQPISKTVSFDLVEDTDEDTENFGPLSGEESNPNEDINDNDTDGSLFFFFFFFLNEDSDRRREGGSDNDTGEHFSVDYTPKFR